MSETGEYPAVWEVQTVEPPEEYPEHQILMACAIARCLNRGLFVLCRPPE